MAHMSIVPATLLSLLASGVGLALLLGVLVYDAWN